MERKSDRAAVSQPELLFPTLRDRRLVVLDEVQFAPHVFPALRPEIDAGRRPGRFLLLGSASGGLWAPGAGARVPPAGRVLSRAGTKCRTLRVVATVSP